METVCPYCEETLDGPVLILKGDKDWKDVHYYHADCIIRMMNELLDPDFDGTGEPEQILRYKGEDLATR